MHHRQPTLVTGTGGFIGFHVARRLLEQGATIHGIDNLCHSYYPPQLKRIRLNLLLKHTNYTHHEIDLSNVGQLEKLTGFFADMRPIIHLAAPDHPPPANAGNTTHPRYNIGNPQVVPLKRCVSIIEKELDIQAKCKYTPLPRGDRPYSCAERELSFRIQTSIDQSLK